MSAIMIYENITTIGTRVTRQDAQNPGIFGFKIRGVMAAKSDVDGYIAQIIEGVNNAYMMTSMQQDGNTSVAVVLHQPGVEFSRQTQTDILSPKCLQVFNKLKDIPAVDAKDLVIQPAGNVAPATKEVTLPTPPTTPVIPAEATVTESKPIEAVAPASMAFPAPPTPTPAAPPIAAQVSAIPGPPKIPAAPVATAPTGIPQAPVAPVTVAPVTVAPVTVAPVTVAPVTVAPTPPEARIAPPVIFSPEHIVRQLHAQMPNAAPTDMLMTARSAYIKHYQAYLEQEVQRPINLLRDDEWRSYGIEPFKIKLTDLDKLFTEDAEVITEPAVEETTVEETTVEETAPWESDPAPEQEIMETVEAVPDEVSIPLEEDDMSAFSTGSYVKVISGALTGHKGIIQTHDDMRATVNLENGVTAQIELSQLAKSRRGEVTNPPKTIPTAPVPAAANSAARAPGAPTAPRAPAAPAASAAVTAPAAPAVAGAPEKAKRVQKPKVVGNATITYKFRIKLFGKITTDATEYPSKTAAETAGMVKLNALKAVLPDAAPTLELEEIQRALSSLTIIGQEPIEGDYDKVLAGAVKAINTMPLPRFSNGIELDVPSKPKFILDLAEKTNVDARILRLLLTPSAN